MKYISREDAKTSGLKRYFTGIECVHGHLAEKMVSNRRCVVCLRSDKKSWDSSNLENLNKSRKKWRIKNRDRVNERQRNYIAIWREKNSTLLRDYYRRRWVERKSELTSYHKAWRSKHKMRLLFYWRKWRENNRETSAELIRRWRRNNPEKVRASSSLRRSRKSGANGSHGSDDLNRIYKLQRGKCAYCRKPLHGHYQVDHIMPLAAGGTNSANNIQLLCSMKVGACNQSKGSKDPIDYARIIGLLI